MDDEPKYVKFEPTGSEPFCPDCGFILDDENQIWCSFCGYNILEGKDEYEQGCED